MSRRIARWTGGLLLTAALGTLLAGCGAKPSAPASPAPAPSSPPPPAQAAPAAPAAPAKPKLETTKVRFGYSSQSTAFLPIYFADKKGYFKDEGLDVEFFTFKGGSENIRAMIGGQIDIASGGFNEPMDGQIAGQDTKVFYGTTNIVVYEWWAQKNIKTPADLKGKKFAVSGIGGQSHLLTSFWLKKIGIDPDKDVQFINSGASSARLSALKAGQVDVAILTSPQTFAAKREGLSMVGKLAEHLSGFPHDVYYAPQAFLTKNPETTRAFIRAINRSVEALRKDKETSVAIVKEILKYSDQDASDSWEEYKNTFPLDGTIDLNGVAFLMDLSVKAGDIKEPMPNDKIINSTFIKEFSKPK